MHQSRLSAQLLQTTWQQFQLECDAELAKLSEWSGRFQLYASKQAIPIVCMMMLKCSYAWLYRSYFKGRNNFNQLETWLFWVVNFLLVCKPNLGCLSNALAGWVEASLDFKYLNDRYQRGREAIQKHMDEKMMMIRCNSLVLAHTQIVQAQAAMGSDGFLI